MYFTLRAQRRLLAITCLFFALSPHSTLAQENEAGQDYEEHAMEEVFVEGVPLQLTINKIAQPTAVVGGNELAKRQAASIGETLSSELGVSSTYFGPVSSRPVIRGQYGERVRVLSNSLDSLDASALSEDHAAGVDSLLAERVEIIRGPATLLYGSGAAGGLVNVVDNAILKDGVDKPASGRVAFGTDSSTGKREVAGEVALGNESLAVHLDYFQRDTDNVSIPGFAESARLRALEEAESGDALDDDEEDEAFGVIENTQSESSGGAVAVSWNSEQANLGVSLRTYESLYGIPGHHHEDDGAAEEEEVVRVDLDQTRMDLEGEYLFSQGGELQLKVARNDYGHVELEGDEIGTVFESDGTDVRLEYQHQPFGKVEGAFGLQYKNIDFVAIGDEAFVPPSETQQTSLFMFESWTPNDDWIVQGSARLERQKITAPDLPDYDESTFGASLGVIYNLSDDYSVGLNYALTQRHPNATELFADGPHLAVQRFERGSVVQGAGMLKKETSSNLDLTLRGYTEKVDWNVTAFINAIDDYILLSPTARIADELQVFEYGQTDARLYGFEAEARIELLESSVGHLHTRLFTDYVYGEDQDTGNYLPRISPLRYGIGFHFLKGEFEAGIDARFHAKQDKRSSNELPTDSYTLVNAEMSYAFEDPNVYAFLRATNLTDEEARQHTSPLKDTVPLPGRSLQLGLRYEF